MLVNFESLRQNITEWLTSWVPIHWNLAMSKRTSFRPTTWSRYRPANGMTRAVPSCLAML